MAASQAVSDLFGQQADRGKLLWGEPKEREAYVTKYGYEDSLDLINSAIKTTPKETKEQKEWHDDIAKYRDNLLSRQGY